MNVTVYLGAHEGNNPVYKQAVAELAIWIAENGHRLVYGGSNEGLMAVIADTVLEQGGEVTGIEAQMFVDKGVAHKNLTQLTIVPNITERRTRMIDDGFSTGERQHGIYFASDLAEIEHIIAMHKA